MATQTQKAAVSSLSDELQSTARHLATVLPAEANQTIGAGIESVKASRLAEKALHPGQQAPDFTLTGVIGYPAGPTTITLSALLQTGPVVLTFYRGNWCPYCNVQLRAYERALPDFAHYGATLVAISPQTPELTTVTAGEKELSFAVLSDVGNQVARQYGLVYAVGGAVYDTLKGVGIDLETFDGDSSGELPLTSTFVIGQDGVIAWVVVDPDFRHRPDPAAIVAALEKLT